MTSPAPSDVYEFQLEIQDSSLTEGDVRRLLQQALGEARHAAAQDARAVEAEAEIRGGFAGLAMPVVCLVIKGFVGGVAGAGGKFFFDKYLKPRLEKVRLFPSRFKNQGQGDKR